MVKTFKGRRITKRTLNIGVGGVLDAPDEFEDLKPRSRIRFEVEADYSRVGHKFDTDGGVEEQHVITLDASTFEVLETMAPVEPPEQPELPVEEGPE
jgi:hypothetical protein